MTLSKVDIQRELGYGDLEIEYEDTLSVEPSSVDLHLGGEILEPLKQKRPVKVDMEATYPNFQIREMPYTIPAYGFVLGYAKEVVDIPGYLRGDVDGRSSVGRLGLFVENAGVIDNGFGPAQITLELFNPAPYPIELKEDMRICQLTLSELESEPSDTYSEDNGNKYMDQMGPTPSKLYEDFE